MTRKFFHRTIGPKDDDLNTESSNATKTENKKLIWSIIVTIVVCLIVVTGIVWGIINSSDECTDDPNWHKTHYTALSVDDAIEKFGDDLLLEGMVLEDAYPAPYVEFILEYAEDGSLNDRQSWRHITTSINYGGGRFDVSEDHINLHIFFKEDDVDLDGSDEYPGYRSMLADASITEINGVTVTYRDWSGDDSFTSAFAYSFWAEFNYGGNIFFMEAFSKENEMLFWDTITQMLDS